MNILVLTGRYLPKMSPNSLCVDHVIRCMPASGNKITCICYDDKLPYTDDRVKIVKVSRGIIKTVQYQLEGKTSLGARIVKKACSLIEKIEMALCIPFWPWLDPLFTKRVYETAKRTVENEKIDAIIAVHMPLSSVIVGAKLKQEHPQIKFYPYFLDSLSGGRPLSCFSLDWNTKKKLKWEKRLLPYADKIIVMNSSRAHHEKYSRETPYYNRFVFLDIPLLTAPKKKECKNPFDSQFVNILFCGTANSPLRNMEYFSRLAHELKETRIRFTVIGECNCVSLFQDSNIKYIPPMAHNDLQAYLANADAFINFGVRTPSAISGKIFEYMSYGKPIVSTFSIDDEACIPYLEKYPASLLMDERSGNVRTDADRLQAFIDKWAKETIDLKALYALYEDNLPESFLTKVLFNQEGMQ